MLKRSLLVAAFLIAQLAVAAEPWQALWHFDTHG